MDNNNALPIIHGSHPSKIHQFCQTLNYNVQSLETLGKVSDCLSMVRGVLDKLLGIKPELVSNKVGWQDWGFGELLQALEEWKEIHPLETNHKNLPSQPRVTHRSWECDRITSPTDRRRVLKNKHLCFNCTGPQHNASQWGSRATCLHCKQRHHSSICDKAEGRDRKSVV